MSVRLRQARMATALTRLGDPICMIMEPDLP